MNMFGYQESLAHNNPTQELTNRENIGQLCLRIVWRQNVPISLPHL